MEGAIIVTHSPVVDDPVISSVATTIEHLREAGVMTIRLHERWRPEMVALFVFALGGPTVGERSGVLVFDVDHWAAGPNVPGAYFDYLGDRWTPTDQLVTSVLDMLSGTRRRSG
jgi:hypothetical protein